MSFGGGSSGGGQTTTQSVQPYAAAQPALNQIISEAGQLYAQGPQAAGYVVAPALSLQQYAGLVSPIASGFPVTSGQVNTRANPLTTAAGGAILGSAIPGVGPLLGAAGGFIGGLL
jgi:hypothetical protein